MSLPGDARGVVDEGHRGARPPDERLDAPRVVDERLLAVLDADPVRAEARYQDLGRQLARFFEWRRCASPEDLSQEVLFRGLRRIAGGVDVYASDPRSYFFGIAHNVLKESYETGREELLDPVVWDLQVSPSRDSHVVESRQALRRVLEQLKPDERRMFVEYYTGDDQDRRRQAEAHGITPAALRVRIHRILQRVRKSTREGEPHERRRGRGLT